VTRTLKYDRCEWLTIEALEEHYTRAELDATIRDDRTVEVKEPVNVVRFSVPSALLARKSKVSIGRTEFPVPERLTHLGSQTFDKKDGKWVWPKQPAFNDNIREDRDDSPVPDAAKRNSQQGPIDDAFTSRFLCVRGTGRPWNSAVGAWADASLKRFADEWARYFRGDLPVKDDKDVTADDIERCNLILFGDPGSNSFIARALPTLPITWTRDELTVGDRKYPAATHAPVLIQPNRVPRGGNYVVLNSGHTFHAKELSTLNYLLFPRLGDWAVVKVGDPPEDVTKEEAVRAGLFDERWMFPGLKPR
jgi:hypothetical protein